MQKQMNLIFALFLMLNVTVTIPAASFYVSPKGDDTALGIAENPWRTLDRALRDSRLQPGDTIQISEGVYTNAALTRIGGNETNLLTIKGAGPGKTIISGGGMTIDQAYYRIESLTFDLNFLLLVGKQCHHLVITNCEFKRGVAGIMMRGNNDDETARPSFVQITDCEFHHPAGNAMVALTGDHHLIENNTFRDNAGFDAIRVFGMNHIIRKNRFLRIKSAAGISTSSLSPQKISKGQKSFFVSTTAPFVKDDRVTITSLSQATSSMSGFVTSQTDNTLVVDIDSFSGDTSKELNDWTISYGGARNHADIIQTFASSTGQSTKALLFEDNYAEGCTSQFGMLENNPSNDLNGDWIIRNNVFNRSRIQLNVYIPNVRIYNNTFYDTQGYTIGLCAKTSNGIKGEGTNMRVVNNLFIHVNGPASGSGAYSIGTSLGGFADYNILTSTADSGFDSLPAGGGLHTINGNVSPSSLFSDVTNNDFSMKPNSIAIGRGLNDQSYPMSFDVGLKRNIGAYYTGGSSFESIRPPNRLRILESN
jgi:hypothetical protein